MDNENTILLFTYGTLMKGLRNSHILAGADFIGNATTKPSYKLVSTSGNYAFPGIVEGGEQTVKGELYKVSSKMVKSMDYIEGHPTFFCRKPVELGEVIGEDGSTVDTGAEVISYFAVDERLKQGSVIENGDWRSVGDCW